MEMLHVENLSFTYPQSARPAVSGVTFSVEAGEFAVLMGATGSGKSTLLRLLKREIAPRGEACGEVTVSGRPLSEIPPEKIGFVADYEGRSVNSHILVLIRDNIKVFEAEHGKIEGNISPDINVKPTRK